MHDAVLGSSRHRVQDEPVVPRHPRTKPLQLDQRSTQRLQQGQQRMRQSLQPLLLEQRQSRTARDEERILGARKRRRSSEVYSPLSATRTTTSPDSGVLW